MVNRVYIKGISVDVTRRCNVECKHCLRGDAENEDITKEIIDRLLDEIQDFYILKINITGGEPCLNPDMVLYFAEQISKRGIKVLQITMPSNGTIQNEVIKQAFSTFAEYFLAVKNEKWYKDICKYYNVNVEKNVVIVLSQEEHENKNILAATKKYYSTIPYDNFEVCLESDVYTNKQTLFIMGRLEKEYSSYTKEKMQNMIALRKDDKYCLINDLNDGVVSVEKTISISTDGSIYPGLSSSWDNLKNKCMGNILECKCNFLGLIDDFSWNHPINKDAYELRELYNAILWHREHNIDLDLIDNQTQETIIRYQPIIDLYEQTLKEFHKEYANLNHEDIRVLVVAVMAVCFFQKDCDEQAYFILSQLGGLSDEETALVQVEDLKKIVNILIKKNKKRWK